MYIHLKTFVIWTLSSCESVFLYCLYSMNASRDCAADVISSARGNSAKQTERATYVSDQEGATKRIYLEDGDCLRTVPI